MRSIWVLSVAAILTLAGLARATNIWDTYPNLELKEGDCECGILLRLVYLDW